MNDILLLLWMGDVAVGVATTLTIFTVLNCISIGFAVLFLFIEKPRNADEIKRIVIRYALPILCVTALLSSIIPSKQWFYIAAGGTATVKALDSEIGKKVQSLVTKKLDDALGEQK